MRPDDFRSALNEIERQTKKPYGVNIPLNNPRAAELLDIAYEARIPVMIASQGGPREHLARFRAIGTKWLHVVASVEHAKKAVAAGVDEGRPIALGHQPVGERVGAQQQLVPRAFVVEGESVARVADRGPSAVEHAPSRRRSRR